MLMQIYADVTGCAMQVSASGETCALGAALADAVLAGPAKGGYGDFTTAQDAMTAVKPEQFDPNPAAQQVYDQLYALYRTVHDGFGGVSDSVDITRIMKDLIDIKDAQSK